MCIKTVFWSQKQRFCTAFFSKMHEKHKKYTFFDAFFVYKVMIIKDLCYFWASKKFSHLFMFRFAEPQKTICFLRFFAFFLNGF